MGWQRRGWGSTSGGRAASPRTSPWWGASVSVALALALVGAACSDDGGEADSGEPGPDDALSFSDDRAGETIRIGYVNTEGGALPLPEFRIGGEVAVDLLNDQGGVDGATIEVVPCATDGTSESSVACANQLVDEDVVAVFVGFDFTSDDMLPVLGEAGIPYISTNSWGPEQRTDPNATLLHSATGAFGLAPLRLFADQGLEKVGVIVEEGGESYLSEIAEPLGEGALGLDIEPVAIDPARPDYPAVLNRLVGAGVEAIHAQLTDVGCLGLVGALPASGFDGPLFAGSCSLYLELAPEAAVGTYAQTDTLTPRTRAAADDEVAERLDEYEQAMTDAGQAEFVNGFAAAPYGAMFELAEIMRRIEGPITAGSLRTALDEPVTTPGWLGPDLECGAAPWPEEPRHCRADVIVFEVVPDGNGDGLPDTEVEVDFHRPLDGLE